MSSQIYKFFYFKTADWESIKVLFKLSVIFQMCHIKSVSNSNTFSSSHKATLLVSLLNLLC